MITPNEKFWEVFKATPGAFSTAEAICLMNIAAQAPSGNYVELGSHKGKSALAASQGLGSGIFYLVEPEFKDDNWHTEVINLVFRNSKNHVSPKGIADYSTNVIGNTYAIQEPYAYVFVDSGVHDDLVMEEVKMLEDRVVPNGIIAFHDYLNQFTAVERAFNYLLSTGKYEKIEINWQEIFDYVAEHDLENGNNSWHLYPELPHPPNFVGALRRL